MTREPAGPARVSAADVANLIEALIDQLIEARGDDDAMGELASEIPVDRVASFGAAGLLTRESGVVITLETGEEFQVTIVRSR